MNSLPQQEPDENKEPQIQLSVTGITRFLSIIAILLVMVSVIGQMISHLTDYDLAFGLIPLVYVNAELSIPTIFSVLLLFFCALLLAVIVTIKIYQNETGRVYWGFLTAGFLFMTFDEGASIHELLDDPMRRLLGSQSPDFLHFAWVVPIGIVIIILGFFFISFLKDLPKTTRRMFVLAAVLYVSGAVGMEMLSGRYAASHGSDNFVFSMLATAEEALEMIGIILFIYALLNYLEEQYQGLFLEFRKKSNGEV